MEAQHAQRWDEHGRTKNERHHNVLVRSPSVPTTSRQKHHSQHWQFNTKRLTPLFHKRVKPTNFQKQPLYQTDESIQLSRHGFHQRIGRFCRNRPALSSPNGNTTHPNSSSQIICGTAEVHPRLRQLLRGIVVHRAGSLPTVSKTPPAVCNVFCTFCCSAHGVPPFAKTSASTTRTIASFT